LIDVISHKISKDLAQKSISINLPESAKLFVVILCHEGSAKDKKLASDIFN